MKAQPFFRPANALTARVVEIQSGNGGPPDGRQTFNAGLVETEVFQPSITARMKQWDRRATGRINGGDAIRFTQVATGTGQREVREFVGATLGARQNVFDVEGRTLQTLVHEAVLAAVRRPVVNRVREFTGEIHPSGRPRI